MTIPKKELEKLVEKYEAKAAKAFDDYQQTGMTRYETAYHNAQDLADSLRMALDASDDHHALLHFRSNLSMLAGEAAKARTPEEKDKVLKQLVSLARMNGLIGDNVWEVFNREVSEKTH